MTTAIPFERSLSKRMTDTASPQIGKNFGLDEVQFNELLQQLEQGDERLFERVFVSQFRQQVRKICASHRAERADAEDATMVALLDFRRLLLAQKVTFGNLEAYFTRMVVTGYQKKQSRRREHSVDSFAENLAQDDDTPAFSAEEMAAFGTAWEALCEKCRAVLQGFYYDDLPHQRIAEIMGKKVDAVKQDKHRCIEKLRKNFFLKLV